MDALKGIIEFMASYPLWAKLIATGSLAVTIITLIFAPRVEAPSDTKVKADIRINSPRSDQRVPWSFPVEGTGVIPDGLELWVFTTDSLGHRYWPQSRAVPRADKTWSGQVHGIGGEPGTARTFGVFLVGPEGQVLLDLWKRAAANQPSIELTQLTQDIQRIQEVSVVAESGKPKKE